MFLAIFWVFCGVVCAVIAHEKNRGRLDWFVLGLLFNVFGIVAVALMSKLPPGSRPPFFRKPTGFEVLGLIILVGFFAIAYLGRAGAA